MLSSIPVLGNISYPVLVLQHADGLLYAGLYNPANKDVKIVRSRAAVNELKEMFELQSQSNSPLYKLTYLSIDFFHLIFKTFSGFARCGARHSAKASV